MFSTMVLSAEATIALISLVLIASVPGIRLAVRNRELLRQWWSRGTSTEGSALALSGLWYSLSFQCLPYVWGAILILD
jgi:hypothetical protein